MNTILRDGAAIQLGQSGMAAYLHGSDAWQHRPTRCITDEQPDRRAGWLRDAVKDITLREIGGSVESIVLADHGVVYALLAKWTRKMIAEWELVVLCAAK